MDANTYKTISQWAEDPKIPLSKTLLWKAIQEGNLKASRPIGAKMWLIKWSDLESYLSGQK
jgi:hypothetical protein